MRGSSPAATARSDLEDHLAFGEWFRRHALDPTHMPHVIRVAPTGSWHGRARPLPGAARCWVPGGPSDEAGASARLVDVSEAGVQLARR